MRVHLGSDHAGFELKAHLVAWLESERYDVVDHGPVEFDPVDDYPPYVLRAAQAVVNDRGSLGIVLGGSGNGEQIAANKVRGVRAALAWTDDTAVLARQHNDANVISIGARQHTVQEAIRYIDAFIAEPFSGDERHARRIAQLAEYETTGDIAGKGVDADRAEA
jgi:ribose 5-phosphate isomerase B